MNFRSCFALLVGLGVHGALASISSSSSTGQHSTGNHPRLRPRIPRPPRTAADHHYHGRTLQKQQHQKERGLDRPKATIRLPAEYEPVASVVLSAVDFHNETLELATTLLESTLVDVFMVGAQEQEQERIFGHLEAAFTGRYTPLPFSLDTVWTRDYGPVGVLLSRPDPTGAAAGATEETMAIVNPYYGRERPSDDALPCRVSDSFDDWSCYKTDLYFEGGNLMSDGRGNLFTTTRVYDWNPDLTPPEVDASLKETFGVHTIHALDFAKDDEGEPLDNTGHIDMFAKIVDPCHVIVAQTHSAVYRDITQAAADYFEQLPCAGAPDGTLYQVHRVKGWNVAEDMYDDEGNKSWTRNTWYTYSNSLIVNDVVILPSYTGGDDAEAMLVYKTASPQRSVYTVNMDHPILENGAVHCMTRQLPVAVNSPSLTGLALPNVTCSGIISPETCDVTKSSSPFCHAQISRLQYSVTAAQCSWNELYFERMCCTAASDRVALVPGPYPQEQRTTSVRVTLMLDQHPEETAWVILDDDLVPVASSAYYGPELANTTVEVFFDLPPGFYTTFVLDGGGDGITGDRESWFDNMDNNDDLTTIDGFDRMFVKMFEIREDDSDNDDNESSSSSSESLDVGVQQETPAVTTKTIPKSELADIDQSHPEEDNLGRRRRRRRRV